MWPTRSDAAMLPARWCPPRRRWCCGPVGRPKLPPLTSGPPPCCWLPAGGCAPPAWPAWAAGLPAAAAAAASAAAVSSRCSCSSAHCCWSRVVPVGTDRSSSRPLITSWNRLQGAACHRAGCCQLDQTEQASRAQCRQRQQARVPGCEHQKRSQAGAPIAANGHHAVIASQLIARHACSPTSKQAMLSNIEVLKWQQEGLLCTRATL